MQAERADNAVVAGMISDVECIITCTIRNSSCAKRAAMQAERADNVVVAGVGAVRVQC